VRTRELATYRHVDVVATLTDTDAATLANDLAAVDTVAHT
jgi:hypothetical protein